MSIQRQRLRVELFFKTAEELRQRVKFLHSKGFGAFNLVNKNKSDTLKDWVDIVKAEAPECSLSAHYSLKYNKKSKKDGGDEGTYVDFSSFLNEIEKRQCTSHNGSDSASEVLLISGSGRKENLDSVAILQRLKHDRLSSVAARKENQQKVGVAYNPFFPSERERENEKKRLLEKLDSSQVNKIYLQFGTDITVLRSSLEWLMQIINERYSNIDICGSIFLPTKKLIAQQKFRPWNGVFLSDEFLSGEEGARRIVLDMINMYQEFEVELLFEAPGIRSEKDVDILNSLIEESCNSDIIAKKGRKKSRSQKAAEKKEEEKIEKSPPKRPRKESIATLTKKSPPASLSPSPLVDDSRLSSPCILLFGSFDVRLHDNRAVELASFHSSVIPVYLYSKKEEGRWGVTGASEVVLKDALRSLDDNLNANRMQLVCRSVDDSVDELLSLCKECGATAVYSNIEHTPEGRRRDEKRSDVLRKNGVLHIQSQSSLLYDPKKVSLSTGFNGGHWGTLMPFLKTCKQQLGVPPHPPPKSATVSLLSKMKCPAKLPYSIGVEGLPLAVIKGKEQWDRPIRQRFPMSESEAEKLLDAFINDTGSGLKQYEKERSRADLDTSTSKLSAHLRIGTLRPNEVYHLTESCSLTYEEKKIFSRRIIWRDLAYYQLFNFPLMRSVSIREHYEKTKWVDGEEEKKRLKAWKKGETGYPIVDAGMRELYKTGWMTQSVRMIVASFLVEHLRVNWVKGCEWFHYTLVDADSAINAMMWQNAGRSGIDQWNFVLSPETASQDPSGKYTKTWVPELSGLHKSKLHQPWKLSEDELKKCGVILGVTYPHRIVDLKAERQKSLDSVLEMRRESQDFNDAGGYDIITLPNGRTSRVFTKKEYRIDSQGEVMKTVGKGQTRRKKS